MLFLKRGTIVAAAGLLLSCAPVPKTADMPGPSPAAAVVQPKSPDSNCIAYREQGVASWYGMDLHGKKTASGEIFDMNGISVAHRTLPLGTVVRITNLDSFKSIKARVNDRGPLYRNRVIELSYGAAKELGFAETGTAPVKIEVIELLSGADAVFTVHAGSFLEEEGALSLKDRLGKKFETVSIDMIETNMARFYRVRVGNYSSEEKAERVAAKLTLEGVEPVVLRKDY